MEMGREAVLDGDIDAVSVLDRDGDDDVVRDEEILVLAVFDGTIFDSDGDSDGDNVTVSVAVPERVTVVVPDADLLLVCERDIDSDADTVAERDAGAVSDRVADIVAAVDRVEDWLRDCVALAVGDFVAV
jgi:hypothetical protein